MDPSHESEEDEAEADDKRQENYVGGARGTTSFRGREPISPQKGGSTSYDSWSSGTRTTPMTPSRELSRNLSSRGFPARGDDYRAEAVNGSSSWSQVKERETSYHLSSRSNMNMHVSSSAPEVGASRITSSAAVPESQSVGASQSAPKINETEKIWHYQDPAGKIHGPFSMVQLRKWNNTGYFPVDLRIWKTTEGQEESILLTDALNGKFHRDPPSRSNSEQNRGTLVGRASVEIPRHLGGEWGSSGFGTNLPSPTPGQATTTLTKSVNMFSSGNGGAQAPTLASSALNSLSQVVQKPEMGMLLGSSISAPSQMHLQATVPGGDSYSNQVVGLHNLVQAVVRNQNQNPIQAEAVAPSSAHKSEPVNMPSQTQVQGPWTTNSGAVPSIPSFASHGSSSVPLPNMNWPVGNNSNISNNATNNYNATTQNMGWTPMPGNAGWTAAPVPGNTTMNWGAQTQGAPSGNPSWLTQGQVQAPGNPTQMGWASTGNPNPGFTAPGQGPAPAGSNSTNWASSGNQNGDGYQRNRAWSRQSSFGSGGGSGGGGGGGGSSRMGGWCRFFRENGHCKKGASCNYRHT
ncbi:hypothetical protein CRG98_024846 [Punica granatum]|nr:hypothetical protein CRG98_024846 [Punica granatum]